MKKKILALAIAGALACPQVAFAAEDDSGMQYTSASEGLFGSLRTRFNTGNKKGDNTVIEADGSVFGYRGSLDLGNGLTGLYHYEQRILAQDGEGVGNSGNQEGAAPNDDDKGGDARFNFVGVRGAFGEVNFGSHGAFVAGVPNVTDVTANGGGNFVPFYRRGRSFQYVSPELNGFQAGGHVRMTGGKEGTAGVAAVREVRAGCYTAANAALERNTGGAASGTAPVALPTATANDTTTCPLGTPVYVDAVAAVDAAAPTHGAPNVDQWAIAATYKVRGFRVGATYMVDPEQWSGPTTEHASDDNLDTLGKQEDMTQWFVSGKYSQDNWAVAVMHGQKNTSDNPNKNTPGNSTKWQEDETVTSFGGNITVGKVGLAVLHDLRSDTDGESGMDKTVTAFSATYNFTSRSRVWAAYIANDDDGADNEKDQITIGMRMDF